jgi:hypothetical protein
MDIYNTHTQVHTQTHTCRKCMGKQGNVALHLPYEAQDILCTNIATTVISSFSVMHLYKKKVH